MFFKDEFDHSVHFTDNISLLFSGLKVPKHMDAHRILWDEMFWALCLRLVSGLTFFEQ